MATIAVDTLRLARRLEAAGFPSAQAQGAAEAIADAITEGVATRSDLRETELRLGSRIEETRLELEKQIEQTRLELEKQIEQTRLGLEKQINQTRLELEKQIEQTRLGLEARLAETKADLMRWMFGAVGLQTLAILGGVAALLKLIP